MKLETPAEYRQNKCAKVTYYKCHAADIQDQTQCKYYIKSNFKRWEDIEGHQCHYASLLQWGAPFNCCLSPEAIKLANWLSYKYGEE